MKKLALFMMLWSYMETRVVSVVKQMIWQELNNTIWSNSIYFRSYRHFGRMSSTRGREYFPMKLIRIPTLLFLHFRSNYFRSFAVRSFVVGVFSWLFSSLHLLGWFRCKLLLGDFQDLKPLWIEKNTGLEYVSKLL